MVYKFNGRRIPRDPRLRKWDENWNELLLATLAGIIIKIFFLNKKKSELYVELIVCTSSFK